MKRFELRIPNLVIALACLGLTNACTIESNQEKDDGTGGSSAGSGGQSNSGGSSAGGGGSSAGSGGQSNSGGSAGQAAGGAAGTPGGGGSAGAAGTPGGGGSAGAAGAAGAGGGSGLPWPVKSCNDLCQYQPEVTSAETQCATVQAELKGYPVTSTTACYGILSIGQCLGCYAAVKMADADCAAIGNACLK